MFQMCFQNSIYSYYKARILFFVQKKKKKATVIPWGGGVVEIMGLYAVILSEIRGIKKAFCKEKNC